MPFDVFFDGPGEYDKNKKYYSCGSSPALLDKLLNYLDANADTLVEINIALYLFNNNFINEKLIELSLKGILVNVYTIPIEGYDKSNPQPIVDRYTGSLLTQSNKYDLAKDIFQHHYRRTHRNFNLYFFPHIFLRSAHVKNFARGNMPYSLHAKSFLFKHKNGDCDVAISSSNFAVRDLVKEENLLFICNEKRYNDNVLHFFEMLHTHAIHIAGYGFKEDYSDYHIKTVENNSNENGGFLAPFYKDSSLQAEDHFKHLLQQAKEKIIIVGQHICPIDYELDRRYCSNQLNVNIKRSGFVNDLIEKSHDGIAVNILSQTFSDGSDSSVFRRPANQKNFIEFFNLLKTGKNIIYQINDNCHNKYIIIDNSVIVSTFNYTPTQFTYLDAVSIASFTHNPEKSYKGIYAETGQYVVINDKEIVKKYCENFAMLQQYSFTAELM